MAFGTLERVKQVLAACGRQINTAFVEQLNLDIRQRVAAAGRLRSPTLTQGYASVLTGRTGGESRCVCKDLC